MIQNFPDEISHDILFRLPPKSLIRCTAVCKPWKSMIKNPIFIRTHLARTIRSTDQLGTHLLLLHCVPRAVLGIEVYNLRIGEPTEEQYYLHYDNNDFEEYCKIQCPIVPKEKLYNQFLRVVGSCNGLVFLAHDKDRLGYTFIICNPSIRKSVTLPKPHLTFKTIGPYYACIGFGYDATTNDYKVVRLLTDQCDNPTFFEVYSLARGSWSTPSHFSPVCEVSDPRKPQAFVNGAIHWLAWKSLSDDSCYQDFILKFDMGTELFSEIMVPKSLMGESSWGWEFSVTGDRKSIALFTGNHGSFFEQSSSDVWVMKQYGLEESWTKVITLGPLGPQRSVPIKALCFRKSGELVLVMKKNDGYNKRHEVVSLDLGSKQLKNLGIHGYIYYHADSYEESLVLLDKTGAVSY